MYAHKKITIRRRKRIKLSPQRASPRPIMAAVRKRGEEFPNKTPSVEVVLPCYQANRRTELSTGIKRKRTGTSPRPQAPNLGLRERVEEVIIFVRYGMTSIRFMAGNKILLSIGCGITYRNLVI